MNKHHVFFLIICLSFLKTDLLFASHAAGGELIFAQVPNTPNQYQFTFKFYRDCSGVAEPSTFTMCYNNSCGVTNQSVTLSKIIGNLPNGQPNGSPITQVGCYNQSTICTGGILPGYREWWYTGTVTLNSTCNFWRFWVALCCRNNAIGNVITPGSQNIFIEANFDNTINLNSSPFVASPPIAYYCVNTPSFAYYTAIDPDGDSLSYESIAPQHNNTGCNNLAPVNIFSAPFNITEPFPTGNTFTVNPLTGVITFTPTTQGVWVFSVKIKEYRNGQYIGFVMRDIQFVVSTCNIPPLNVFATYPPITCYGDLTVISGIGNGGVQPYQYQLNGAGFQPGNQFAGIGAGVYTITVMDANNCTSSTVFTINQPTPFVANVINIVNPPCNTPCIGTAQTTVSGGVSPLQYSINAPGSIDVNTGVMSGLCAGLFTVTVTDANGCTATSAFNITQPTLGVSLSALTNVSCYGMCDGTAQAVNIGGVSPITYSITAPGIVNANTGALSGLCVGSYTVMVTDASSCTGTAVLLVSEPAPLTISVANIQNETCNGACDGSSQSIASGGTMPYLYAITAPGVVLPSGFNTSLCGGNYTVTVTDANGCTATSTFSILPAQVLNVAVNNVNDVSCFGLCDGSSQAVANGGNAPYTYNLLPSGVVNPVTGANSSLCAGIYTVSITDANGCTGTNSFTITQPQQLTLTANNITNVTCAAACDGNALAVATGGISPYVFTMNAPGVINANTGAISGLCAGIYTISVTDANGCTNSATFQVTEPPVLTWTASTITNISCNGNADGSLTLTANGGTGIINYNLQPNNISNVTGQFNSLTAGIYTIVATDANGCSISTTLTITTPAILQITNIASTPLTCVPGNDGTLTVSAVGGTLAYAYNIGGANQAGNLFNNVAAGSYTVIVTDANGCTATSTITIAPPNSPTINSLTATDVLCNGGNNGSITAVASGGLGVLNYNLQPGNQNNAGGLFSNLTAGIYTVTVGDANGCTVSSTMTITEPAGLNWTSALIVNVNCYGGNDGSITIAAAGGTGTINYTLQPGNVNNVTGIFPNLAAGNYTVTGTDANGCTLSTGIQINQPPALTWTVSTVTHVNCNGGADGTITATITGGVAPMNYNLQPNNINNANGLFLNLIAGTYTVLATDANGCTISTIFTVTEPSLLQITNVAVTQPTCVPGNDGSLTITAIGGSGVYAYNIGGANQASNVFLNLASGNYTVTVTDANGCTATSTITIAPPNSPTINSLTAIDILCNGGNNGSITAVASGGLGVLNYNLQPGNQNNAGGLFSNLTAGIYTVTVGDANGCTVSSTIAILQPTAISWVTLNVTNVNCNGGSDGSITATAFGGTGALTYTLQPNNITNAIGIFANLTAGAYTVTAVDANNCNLTIFLQVTQSTPIIFTTVILSDVSCNGGNDGSITTAATGGTAPMNYNLQPNNINNANGLFANLIAGSYTVQATDANGCTMSTVFSISEPPLLQVVNIAITQPSCVPGNDGSIAITASGGTPAYNYNIGGVNQFSGVFNNVGAGIYTVTTTDANGCAATSIVIIAPPGSPIITSAVTTPANCDPGTNGAVTITATGGTGIYTYSADGINFQVNNTITGLTAGSYTITVQDALGCTTSSVIVITTTPSPVITNIVVTNATCIPGCDGTATINATGGNAVYTYSIDNINFQAGNLFINVCANIYTATVTDGNNCTASSVFTITSANAPTISLNSTVDILCNGGNNGAISVTAAGAGAITYLLLPTGINNLTGLFSNLTANTYTVQATDVNGCSTAITVLIAEPALLQITNILNNGALCSGANNGNIDIVTSGGTGSIVYAINPFANFVPPAIYNNLIGNTTYTVTATDANGCTATSSVFISEPQPIVFTSTIHTDVTCFNGNNGAIAVQAIGGTGILNYALIPNPQNNITGLFNNLNANSYTVTVSDANNCTLSTIINIAQPPPIVLAALTTTDITCSNVNDGSINIACTGGAGALTYNLQPGNVSNITGIFNNLAGIIYSITITDANGCTLTTTAAIINPLPLNIDSLNNTHVLCHGDSNGSIAITVTGGTGNLNYNLLPQNINNAIGIFNNLPANTYTVTITDANLCSISTIVQIIEPAVLSAAILNIQNILCSGANSGQVDIGATGGTMPYTFTMLPSNISNATGIFANLTAGSYTVNVSDSNNCATIVQPIIITEPTALKFEPLTVQDIKCYGDSTGIISVVVSGGTGNIVLTISPNIGIQTPAGTFTALAAGTYTITATDANNCTLTTTAIITQNPAIIISNISIFNPKCWGDLTGIIHINASGGIGQLTYMLNNQNANTTGFFNQLAAGNFIANIVDTLGCSIDSLIAVTQPHKISLSSLEIFPVYCRGYSDGKIQAQATGGNGGYTYYLRPGLNVNKFGFFENLHEGSYTLSVTDSFGCTFDTVIAVTPPLDPLRIKITKKDLGCYGTGTEGYALANVLGGNAPYTYLWNSSPAQFDAKAIDLKYGKYIVEVIDAKGCTEKDSIVINAGECCEEIFVPNAFSPNGDGNNDIFRVTTSTGIELLQFEIYDRWGKKVWYTDDFREGWDGNERGQPRDMNTYFYIFRYKCLYNGENYVRKGDINLIR